MSGLIVHAHEEVLSFCYNPCYILFGKHWIVIHYWRTDGAFHMIIYELGDRVKLREERNLCPTRYGWTGRQTLPKGSRGIVVDTQHVWRGSGTFKIPMCQVDFKGFGKLWASLRDVEPMCGDWGKDKICKKCKRRFICYTE